MSNPAYAQAFNNLGRSYDAELEQAAAERAAAQAEALAVRNGVIRAAEADYDRAMARAKTDYDKARMTARRRFFGARPSLPEPVLR
jgi:hypothetical protein